VRVIPVLDLLAGRAVLARRAQREAYAPVESVLIPDGVAGDPLALARAFRQRLGCDEWYVADLDAISGGAPQRGLMRALAELGGRALVDAGIATAARARDVVSDGAARVVVGLETLPSFAALGDVAQAVGRERVVFSLDLRDRRPVVPAGAAHRGTPLELARAGVAAGAGALLVLDLARIGTGLGVDWALVGALRGAHPDVELLAGGGVGSIRDLERLADAGCDAALVASALHAGGLERGDIEAVRRRWGSLHPRDSR
jgi:phosphoribosylformimino-5-aminoimidazole carboxamide ribotide isomerase